MNYKNILILIIVLSFLCTSCIEDALPKNKIKVAIEGKSYSLNPYIAKEQNSLEIRDLLFLSFFDWDENWNIYPRLADNIQENFFSGNLEDEYTLNVDISPNIRWSDGVFVNTGDVIFSCLALSHPTIEKLNKSWFLDMGKVESSSPYSFSLKLSRADISFMQDFRPIPFYALKDYLFKDSKSFFKDPVKISLVSNGPYKISNYHLKNKAISSVKLIKNNEYSSDTNIDEIDINYYSNISDKKFEKNYKKYDFLPSLNKKRADIISKDNNYNVISYEGTKLFTIFFSMRGITSDVLVRNAIYKQIDRKKIAQEYFGTRVDIAESFLNKKRQDFISLFNYEYSYDDSIISIVDAGMTIKNGKIVLNDEQVKLNIATTKDLFHIARLIKEELDKAGFKTSLNIYKSLSYYDILELNEKPDIFVTSVESDLFTEPGSIFSCEMGNIYSKMPYSNMCLSNWRDELNTMLCLEYLRTADISERNIISEEHQRLVFENLPAIPLFFDLKYCAHTKRISGIKPRGFGSDMWNTETWKVNN